MQEVTRLDPQLLAEFSLSAPMGVLQGDDQIRSLDVRVGASLLDGGANHVDVRVLRLRRDQASIIFFTPQRVDSVGAYPLIGQGAQRAAFFPRIA